MRSAWYEWQILWFTENDGDAFIFLWNEISKKFTSEKTSFGREKLAWFWREMESSYIAWWTKSTVSSPLRDFLLPNYSTPLFAISSPLHTFGMEMRSRNWLSRWSGGVKASFARVEGKGFFHRLLGDFLSYIWSSRCSYKLPSCPPVRSNSPSPFHSTFPHVFFCSSHFNVPLTPRTVQ